jgi:hypothetical protein
MTPNEIEQDRRIGSDITIELMKNTVAPFAMGIAVGVVIGYVIAWMLL